MRSPRSTLTAAALCLLTAVPTTAATRPHAIPAPGPAVVAVPQHAWPAGVPYALHPLLARVRGRTASGAPVLAAGTPAGYGAGALRAYLRLRGDGAGQTVAIVDAFDDPYATRDINIYSRQSGLPSACPATGPHSRNCFSFTRVHPYGIGGLDPGWALEESLDVDMIHALASHAAIVLVEARNNTLAAMYQALAYAAALHPAVISNSWTLGGERPGEYTRDRYCQLATGVCTFATGDHGHPGGYPAYNPAVIAVGGTTLALTPSGAVTSETAWAGSGGGVSQFEPRPPYQQPAINPYAGRGIPDVSFDADPASGVAVYDSASGGWLDVGGTSAGAPAWAAILAAADQLRAATGRPPLTAARAQAQRALYHLRRGLADITTGANGRCGPVCTAGPGYDLVTGLGSPRPGIDTALATAPDPPPAR
jgi:subtilase family serine protease